MLNKQFYNILAIPYLISQRSKSMAFSAGKATFTERERERESKPRTRTFGSARGRRDAPRFCFDKIFQQSTILISVFLMFFEKIKNIK